MGLRREWVNTSTQTPFFVLLSRGFIIDAGSTEDGAKLEEEKGESRKQM